MKIRSNIYAGLGAILCAFCIPSLAAAAELFALEGNFSGANRLIRFDTQTGSRTVVANIGVSIEGGTMTYDPIARTVAYLEDARTYRLINVDTGQSTTASVPSPSNQTFYVGLASSTTDQLLTANQRVAAAFGGGAGIDASGQLTAPNYIVQGTSYNNVGSALDAINTGGTKYYQANSVGSPASATGTDALAMGSGASASGTGTVAIGQGATASHANSVAIGSGSVTSAPNTVAVGSSGSERRVTNVAAGINQTDAVNVGQLQSAVAGMNSQSAFLQDQITSNRTEARRGIAAAAAITPVAVALQPGQTSMSIGGAGYRGEGAVGVNFAHRLKNLAAPVYISAGYSNEAAASISEKGRSHSFGDQP